MFRKTRLTQKLHAHLLLGIDAFECFAEFFKRDRSIAILVLDKSYEKPWQNRRRTYQFANGVISNRRDLIVVNIPADHHFQHFEQLDSIDFQVVISIVHLRDRRSTRTSLDLLYLHRKEIGVYSLAC